MSAWMNRTASPEAGHLDAMERDLRAHYPDAVVEVTHHTQPGGAGGAVVSVSVCRKGRAWFTSRVGAGTLAEAVGEMARAVAGLCGVLRA